MKNNSNFDRNEKRRSPNYWLEVGSSRRVSRSSLAGHAQLARSSRTRHAQLTPGCWLEVSRKHAAYAGLLIGSWQLAHRTQTGHAQLATGKRRVVGSSRSRPLVGSWVSTRAVRLPNSRYQTVIKNFWKLCQIDLTSVRNRIRLLHKPNGLDKK